MTIRFKIMSIDANSATYLPFAKREVRRLIDAKLNDFTRNWIIGGSVVRARCVYDEFNKIYYVRLWFGGSPLGWYQYVDLDPTRAVTYKDANGVIHVVADELFSQLNDLGVYRIGVALDNDVRTSPLGKRSNWLHAFDYDTDAYQAFMRGAINSNQNYMAQSRYEIFTDNKEIFGYRSRTYPYATARLEMLSYTKAKKLSNPIEFDPRKYNITIHGWGHDGDAVPDRTQAVDSISYYGNVAMLEVWRDRNIITAIYRNFNGPSDSEAILIAKHMINPEIILDDKGKPTGEIDLHSATNIMAVIGEAYDYRDAHNSFFRYERTGSMSISSDGKYVCWTTQLDDDMTNRVLGTFDILKTAKAYTLNVETGELLKRIQYDVPLSNNGGSFGSNVFTSEIGRYRLNANGDLKIVYAYTTTSADKCMTDGRGNIWWLHNKGRYVDGMPMVDKNGAWVPIPAAMGQAKYVQLFFNNEVIQTWGDPTLLNDKVDIVTFKNIHPSGLLAVDHFEYQLYPASIPWDSNYLAHPEQFVARATNTSLFHTNVRYLKGEVLVYENKRLVYSHSFDNAGDYSPDAVEVIFNKDGSAFTYRMMGFDGTGTFYVVEKIKGIWKRFTLQNTDLGYAFSGLVQDGQFETKDNSFMWCLSTKFPVTGNLSDFGNPDIATKKAYFRARLKPRKNKKGEREWALSYERLGFYNHTKLPATEPSTPSNLQRFFSTRNHQTGGPSVSDHLLNINMW